MREVSASQLLCRWRGKKHFLERLQKAWEPTGCEYTSNKISELYDRMYARENSELLYFKTVC